MSISAAFFSFFRSNVDPVVIKEFFADFCHFGRKFVISGQNDVFGFFPRIFFLGQSGNRSISVPVFQFIDAQPVCFHFIKAVRNVLMIGDDRIDQSVNDFVFDLIFDISGGNGAFIAAPFVFDLFVFGKRIGNQRKDRHIFFHDAIDFGAGFMAGFCVRRRGNNIHCFGFRNHFSADVKA